MIGKSTFNIKIQKLNRKLFLDCKCIELIEPDWAHYDSLGFSEYHIVATIYKVLGDLVSINRSLKPVTSGSTLVLGFKQPCVMI